MPPGFPRGRRRPVRCAGQRRRDHQPGQPRLQSHGRRQRRRRAGRLHRLRPREVSHRRRHEVRFAPARFSRHGTVQPARYGRHRPWAGLEEAAAFCQRERRRQHRLEGVQGRELGRLQGASLRGAGRGGGALSCGRVHQEGQGWFGRADQVRRPGHEIRLHPARRRRLAVGLVDVVAGPERDHLVQPEILVGSPGFRRRHTRLRRLRHRVEQFSGLLHRYGDGFRLRGHTLDAG